MFLWESGTDFVPEVGGYLEGGGLAVQCVGHATSCESLSGW